MQFELVPCGRVKGAIRRIYEMQTNIFLYDGGSYTSENSKSVIRVHGHRRLSIHLLYTYQRTKSLTDSEFRNLNLPKREQGTRINMISSVLLLSRRRRRHRLTSSPGSRRFITYLLYARQRRRRVTTVQ
jgi:hypothetical protein